MIYLSSLDTITRGQSFKSLITVSRLPFASTPKLFPQSRLHSSNINMSGIPPIEKRLEKLMQGNREYAATYTKPTPLSLILEKGRKAPGGSVIVVSCADPRVDPAHYFKLPATGGVGIVRNAGGRAFDAIRSLAVLDALAPIGTVIVVHHTDCGENIVMDQEVRDNILHRHPELADEVKDMPFGEIPEGQLEQSLLEDIKVLKETPLLRDEINVLALKLDLETGLLTEVKP